MGGREEERKVRRWTDEEERKEGTSEYTRKTMGCCLPVA